MNENSLQTSFWIMVLVQTIGSIDMPGYGERKMPAPRQYVAILVAWLILQLVAGINSGAQRATAAVGWLIVLAGMVVGPFGQRLVGFFGSVSRNFANAPATTPGNTGTIGAQVAGAAGPVTPIILGQNPF